MTEALDFARYAPERPQLAWSQPDAPPRADGELGHVFGVMRNAWALIRQCLRIALGILWRRAWNGFHTRIVASLTSAWVCAGLGWGLFGGLFIVQYFVR